MGLRDEILEQPAVLRHWLETQMETVERIAGAIRARNVDYLFLAFNTSTAFSPTDTAVLSRGAKLGMMAQAIISLTILVLLAARAVNIL